LGDTLCKGGAISTGGNLATGGVISTGGAISTGGNLATGGVINTGGAISAGGVESTGATTGCSTTTDNCPAGQYCQASGNCAKGCKRNSDCASGACDVQHSCSLCVSDDECSAGLYCAAGTCLGACTEATASTVCGVTATCCTERCAETAIDVANCGNCGTTCTAKQFCGTTGCTEASISSLCGALAAVGVLDEKSDDEATRIALAGLAVTCSMVTREVLQSSNLTVNNTTGQPLVRGQLLVAFGGDFYQKVVGYAETNRIAPTYSKYSSGNWQFVLSSNDQVIASLPSSRIDTNHDLLVVETVRDPATGIPMLLGYGIGLSGTTAAAWYFVNAVMPSIASYMNSWYVLEWANEDDAGAMDIGQFTLMGSGSLE
jgi:hypothetical protein